MAEATAVLSSPPHREQSSTAAEIMNLALKVLSARAMVVVALLMVFGLFCWAMQIGGNLPLITAGVFTGLVFLPMLYIFGRGSYGS